MKQEPENNIKSQKERQNIELISGLHIVNVSVFLMMIIFIGLLAVILPKPEVSQIEKRELNKMPHFSLENLFAGELAKGFDLFYADTFPGREGMVALASRINELHGVRPDDVRIHEAPQPQAPQPVEPALPPKNDNNAIVPGASSHGPAPSNGLTPGEDGKGEQMGTVFLYKNMALPIFGANKTASEKYAKTINEYQTQLGDSVQITNLVIPSSIAFYLPEKYKDISGDQKENINFIYSKLSPKIKTVDAYSAIEKAKEEYIYFRSDHHWTVRGAYAAYVAFCKTQGFEPVPLDNMERHQIDDFVGTLYNETQDSALKETPDFVEYFVPPGDYTVTRTLRNKPFAPIDSSLFAGYATGGQNTYSVFLHGDFPVTHVKTKLNTGKKIVMVKESFGNAFAPFLVSHYDEVFIIDQRYFQQGLADFIKTNGVTDLLFINNIFAANTDVRINELERIRNQTYVPYVPKKAEPEPVEPKPETPPDQLPQIETPQEEPQNMTPEEIFDKNLKEILEKNKEENKEEYAEELENNLEEKPKFVIKSQKDGTQKEGDSLD